MLIHQNRVLIHQTMGVDYKNRVAIHKTIVLINQNRALIHQTLGVDPQKPSVDPPKSMVEKMIGGTPKELQGFAITTYLIRYS